MELSIIIVSYNVRYYLGQCIDSIYAAAKDLDFEILVVDNASDDDTPTYLHQRFPQSDYPQLHVTANAYNVGFGRANNQALAHAIGRYILFLNPDTILGETTLHDCLSFAHAHPRLGALGTMMLHTNGSFAAESHRGLPTPWTSFCKMAGLGTLFPKSHTFGGYYMRYLDPDEPARIDIVSGAFMLIPRDVLAEVGGFDEQFFMYGEDIDLSYRLTKSGRENYYIPSTILHYKGESTHKSTYRYVHVFYGAMLIFFRKHYRQYTWAMALPIKAAILSKALLELLWQQIHRIQQFIYPARKRNLGQQLYVGHHGKDVQAIATKYGLSVNYLEADENTLARQQIDMALPENCVHIIFDLEDFSHSYILSFFRHSSFKQHVGTYSPRTHLLITGSYVLSIEGDKTE